MWFINRLALLMRNTTAFLAAFLLFLSSCKKDNNSTPPPPPPQMKSDSTKLTLSNSQNAVDSFTVQYSGKWDITTAPSPVAWLKLSTVTGTGNTKVYVTTQQANFTPLVHSATLNLIPNGDASKATTLSITQNAFTLDSKIKWSKLYGGTDVENFGDVIRTPDGGYISVGTSSSMDGDIIGNHGTADLIAVKWGENGSIVWKKALGGSGGELGYSIVQTTDGNYVIGAQAIFSDGDVTGTHGKADAWVVKINGAGALLWQKAIGGTEEEFEGEVAASLDGGCVLAYTTRSSNGDVTGHHGSDDILLLKLDPAGNKVWQKAIGGSQEERAKGITATADGGYILTGVTNSRNGDFAYNDLSSGAFVIKVDANGNIVWNKTFGGSGLNQTNGMAPGAGGSYYVSGYTSSTNGGVTGNHGSYDFWLLKIDKDGNLVWQKTYGGTSVEYAYAITAKGDGTFYLAGQAGSKDGDVSHQIGSMDGWVINVDANGTLLWQRSFGGSSIDYITGITADGAGGFVFSGVTRSNDGETVNSHGGLTDAWILRYGPQ